MKRGQRHRGSPVRRFLDGSQNFRGLRDAVPAEGIDPGRRWIRAPSPYQIRGSTFQPRIGRAIGKAMPAVKLAAFQAGKGQWLRCCQLAVQIAEFETNSARSLPSRTMGKERSLLELGMAGEGARRGWLCLAVLLKDHRGRGRPIGEFRPKGLVNPFCSGFFGNSMAGQGFWANPKIA